MEILQMKLEVMITERNFITSLKQNGRLPAKVTNAGLNNYSKLKQFAPIP